MADVISDALIDVSLQTGVDVISQRSSKLEIRRIGPAYRVFSLIDPSVQVVNALRIAAYTDVASLVCHELIVTLASQELAKQLGRTEAINYEVHKKAEQYVLNVDFSADLPKGVHYLGASQFVMDEAISCQDYDEHGGALIKATIGCISRGVDAYTKAYELTQYSEAQKLRKAYDWSGSDRLLHKLNERTGHIFWQPPPEIGLGTSVVSSRSTYCGTFRRNTAEGYGCLEWESGVKFYGQVSKGDLNGYGGMVLPDGGRKFGYWPKFSFRSLGAYITPNRDRVLIGPGRVGGLCAYGRQIGLRNGVDSVSGLWMDGKLHAPFESIGDTHQKIADGMKSPFTVELKAQYEAKANTSRAKQGANDAVLLSPLRQFL